MDINELDSYRLSDAVKFHTELNPALWDGDRMRPEVREALIKIADDFREFLGISDLAVEDITVSGSNAAYTYTPHSDIDLHLLVDFSKLNPDQVYQELFNAKKYQYNDQHDIKIRGYDVELYVQDAGKPVRSLGEYSIVRDDWTRIPVRRQGNLDEKSTQAKYEKLRDLIELALTSDDLQTVTNLTDVIKRYRQAGLDEHGEFGPENLAYKILRTQGLVKRLFDHRASLEDSKLSLAERRKKKKKSKKKFRYGAFGGYYYPGYGYYGQTGDVEAADGGGDGGGESMREATEIKIQAKSIPIDKVVRRFVHFAAHYLKLDQLPRIVLQGEKFTKHIHSMGHYVDDKKMIEVATHGRHIMDILRTVAHELTHYRQHERLGKEMPATAGRTGSPYENEANAKAGVIMRHFQNRYPEFFGAETVEEQKLKEFTPSQAGATGEDDDIKAHYGDQTPPGPEFPPTMPAGTLRVDVSDVYDWYKLGQHISNMKGLGKHDFGAGPPSSIISFGDEDTEHEFIGDLEATGLDVTDIDPKDPKKRPGRKIKTDPTYNVNETAQSDSEQHHGWRAELVDEITPTTFEVQVTNKRSRESANFVVRPVDMIRPGLAGKFSIDSMDLKDLQTGATRSIQSDSDEPWVYILDAVSALFWDTPALQARLQAQIKAHQDQGLPMLPGLKQRRSAGQGMPVKDFVKGQQAALDAISRAQGKKDINEDEDLHEGLGKTLATGALAAAAALGQPAQAQDVGRTAYQIGKQIYQPSGVFTRAGAEEELKGIARDMARGSREIRVGGKLIYGGPRPQGERVASNAAAASAEEAYRQALENAINRAQQQHGPITLGPGGWKVVDYEADQMGNTFRAMVAIEGPAPRRESIQTPVSRSDKDREDYYKFVMGKATTGRPLTRSEQEFIKTYRLQQKIQGKVAEDAAGYIPTKKQARDPRFKTALTVDVKPGQVGKEANKLGLQTDSQGRPALLIKNLANALKEYKETGVFEAIKPVTPPLPARAPKTEYPPIVKQKTGVPQDKPRPRPDGTGKFIDYEIKEDEDLMEVKMSPSALEAWARSPEAEGIRAGFEAEMIFRDTKRDEDEDYDQEPDYDYDERPDDIDHVIDFFSNDDYGYGLSRQGARNLRESLWEAYTEWVDEQISESWDENAEDQVRDYMETNVWGDDSERESRIQDKVEEMFGDEAVPAIMKAGDSAPRFTRSSDQDEYAQSNELYQKFKQASDAAYEAFEEEITNEFESQGEYYDAAREYYWDMMREGGEFDERDFLRDRYGYMTDIANEESLDWPYWSGGSSGTGSRDWSDIGDSLQRAIDMPVRVSSGYHSTTRRPGLWIIEPDGSLDPDDRDDEMGLEIVSPPLPLPETLEKLKQVLEWGNSEANAYTNSSTGLHMGISIPYVGGDVDYVKLVLFMGDEYVLDKFGRASNTYAASAMEKLRNSMQVARRRGTLTEARFDPMGALELVQKNLIELAARYVQNGVGTSKYTSAHIQDGYIEFRSPGGDYLSMADRGEEEDIRNTMLRFARAMQIAGSPSLERREYAKKLYKLISPGAQDDGLKLFSQFAAGTITPEELKKQWANAVLQKEIPTTGQEEWEVYDQRKSGPDGVIDSFYADEYDTAYVKAQDKYGNTPEWRNLDIRKKQPWYDVKDSYGDIILTVRARDFDSAKQKVQAEYGDRLSDDWEIYRRPDDTPEPVNKLSPRAQVAKRLKQPKVTPAVAADNEKDSQQIQARIGEPRPAGAVRDTGYYRVTWDERRNGAVVSDALNVDAENANAAMDRVRNALQAQGRDIIQISADAQEPPAWRRNREPVATSTQGEFSGQWQVRNANTGEVVYTFGGVGNNQGDANRVAQQWVQRTRFDDPVEVVPELR